MQHKAVSPRQNDLAMSGFPDVGNVALRVRTHDKASFTLLILQEQVLEMKLESILQLQSNLFTMQGWHSLESRIDCRRGTDEIVSPCAEFSISLLVDTRLSYSAHEFDMGLLLRGFEHLIAPSAETQFSPIKELDGFGLSTPGAAFNVVWMRTDPQDTACGVARVADTTGEFEVSVMGSYTAITRIVRSTT